LVTAFNRPFTPAGFGNWFRDQCDQACVKRRRRHWTAHEIAAVTGHTSLEEVERYTRAARKSKLADAAIAKLK